MKLDDAVNEARGYFAAVDGVLLAFVSMSDTSRERLKNWHPTLYDQINKLRTIHARNFPP